MEVEHSLYTLLLSILQCSLGEFQCEFALLRRIRGRELHGACSHYSTLLHHVVHEVELAERGKVVVIEYGHRSTVLRYFPEDSLHLVIPYSDITKERAEEIAKFIVVKKELHERSNMDG
jgi:hypothetical protein